ncbi:hypothetical protein [Nonomuraea sp. NPDC049480]|uniref:hypothetical protein n=1 Tax=Nonomuraea sp. NPDC049480 TaxID=3364353 RepID=UPI0037A17C1D
MGSFSYRMRNPRTRALWQKADKDPAEWLPIEQVRCRYVAEWVAIERHWQLGVDAAEKTKLTEIAQGCPNAPLTQAA